MPAMSNSGSGNQGIAATMPVVVVAEHVKADDEKRVRALVLSHLMAIYIHSKLPKLSALCAVTTAAMVRDTRSERLTEPEPLALDSPSMPTMVEGSNPPGKMRP